MRTMSRKRNNKPMSNTRKPKTTKEPQTTKVTTTPQAENPKKQNPSNSTRESHGEANPVAGGRDEQKEEMEARRIGGN